MNVLACDGDLVTLKLGLEAVPSNILQGRAVKFDSGAQGVVVWQRLPLIFVLSDPDSPAIKVGEAATLEKERTVMVPVSSNMLGRVVDYMGRPLDGKGELKPDTERELFGESTKQAAMATISQPLHTGVTAVDALTPIGRGQNMLLVASKDLGRQELALDAAVHQASQAVACIYVCTTGQHEAVLKELQARGAAENTLLVAGIGGVGRGVAAAAAAAGFAEHLSENGKHVLVIVDDLEGHKEVWDGTERALLQHFGAEQAESEGALSAANSEMRAFYAALFQRVGCLNKAHGGGSLSMLLLLDRPVTNKADDEQVYTLDDFPETLYGGKVVGRIKLMQDRGIPITSQVLSKLSIPSPGADAAAVKFRLQHIDELTSLSDGHIHLTPKLHAQGLRPGMDHTTSLTRIGIGADNLAVPSSAAMRQVAARLRFDLAQASDIPPDDKSPAAAKQRARARAWQAVLQQPWGSPRSFPEQILGLLAAGGGLLDARMQQGLSLDDAQAVLAQAVAAVRAECAGEVQELEHTLSLSPKAKTAFAHALKAKLKP